MSVCERVCAHVSSSVTQTVRKISSNDTPKLPVSTWVGGGFVEECNTDGQADSQLDGLSDGETDGPTDRQAPFSGWILDVK